MEQRKLKMSFKDDKNNSKMLTMDFPKAFYDEGEVKVAMDKIIASKVLQTKEGPVTSKVKAYEETITRKEENIE
jgi:hypothetical protein